MDWKKKVHDSTNVIIASISQLHTISPSRENTAKVTRLVTAMVDIIDAQEEANTSLQEQLNKERQWRLRVEKRIEELEIQVHRNHQYGGAGILSSEFGNVHAPQHSSVQVLSQTADREEHFVRTEEHAISSEGGKNIQQFSDGSSMRQSGQRAKSTGDKRNEHQFSKQEYQDGQEIATRTPSKVEPPFTIADVLHTGRQRRKQKRDEQNFQPPPCNKCRLHKRALMQKKNGYVKEDVFLRWANRPGACFEFIHYDEDLPADHPRSQLSFAATETQDPDDIQ